MRTIVGDRTVDEVITVGRQEIEKDAMEMMKNLVEKYELGIGVDQIPAQERQPPFAGSGLFQRSQSGRARKGSHD